VLNPWWSVLNDSTVEALISETLDRNPDVTIAAARVAEARSVLRETRAQQLPTLEANANASRSRVNGALLTGVPGSSFIYNDFIAQGAVAYETDFWGRYFRASQAARARLAASEFDREAVKLSLSGDVARRYYQLIAATHQLAIARSTLKSRDEALQIEQVRANAGESDELTLRRAEADAAAARSAVAQLELQVARLDHSLSVLLGRSPKELTDGVSLANGVALPAVPLVPTGLPSEILARRPDLQSAEATLFATTEDVGAARASLFPSIRLTGTYGRESAELSDLFTSPNAIWSVGAALTQPLFEGGRLRAALSGAKARQEQARAQYARTVQTAFREVLDGLRGESLLARIEQSNSDQVKSLSRATELAELRYNEGDLAYIDLLDARRSLYQAQLDLVSARRDALLNVIDIALGLGGGLGPRAEPISARR
jgi:multidrug efflux system outer membrane protein